MVRHPLPILCALVILVSSATAAQAVDLKGRGSVGGSAGMMRFVGGEEFGNSPKPRFIFQAMFSYNVTDAWSFILESGWGWNAYDNSEPDATSDTLATVIPTTIGFRYRLGDPAKTMRPVLGAGLGLYSMGVKDDYNSWASSNMGTQRLTWNGPGLYGRAGLEWIYDSGAALNVDFMYHYILASDDKFDKWGNQNTSFAEIRIGGSYYFALVGGGGDDPGDD